MKSSIFDINGYHILSFLALTISATYWAVATDTIVISAAWMFFLLALILLTDIRGMKVVTQRLAKFAFALAVVSLYQIVFRRSGEVVWALRSFPLVYADGLRQAVLLWLRYLIIFEVALLFSRMSHFHLFLFLSKCRFSFAFNLLLLVTLRFLPFVSHQVRLAIWTMRFNGADFRGVKLKEKFHLVTKMLKPVLHAGFQYASISALALELRGYGSVDKIDIKQRYPMRWRDAAFLAIVIVGNALSL